MLLCICVPVSDKAAKSVSNTQSQSPMFCIDTCKVASNQLIPGGNPCGAVSLPGYWQLTDLWLPLLCQLPRIIPGHAHVVQDTASKDDLGSLHRRVQEFPPGPGQAHKLGLQKTNGKFHNAPGFFQGPVVPKLCLALGVPDRSHQPRQLRVTSIRCKIKTTKLVHSHLSLCSILDICCRQICFFFYKH